MSQGLKSGVWSAGLSFSPHFRNHLSIICGSLWNPRERRAFSLRGAVPSGAPGARPFWLNCSIFNAHRAQFSMTIRSTFKWTSADGVGEGESQGGWGVLALALCSALIGLCAIRRLRYDAGLRFFEIPHRHLSGPFMSALVVML